MPDILDDVALPIVIDGRTVRAGQVWATKSDRKVLIVNLVVQPKTRHQLGFVWFDKIDCDVNVTEVAEQLKTFLFEGDCTKWEDMLNHLQKTSEKNSTGKDSGN